MQSSTPLPASRVVNAALREPADARFEAYARQLQSLVTANLAYEENECRWRTAFESSAIGIVMADAAGRYFAANKAFQDMLGYTPSELYRLSFTEVTYEEDREADRRLVSELIKGKQQHFQIEKRYCRKDGTFVCARTNVALVPGTSSAKPSWFGIGRPVFLHCQ